MSKSGEAGREHVRLAPFEHVQHGVWILCERRWYLVVPDPRRRGAVSGEYPMEERPKESVG